MGDGFRYLAVYRGNQELIKKIFPEEENQEHGFLSRPKKDTYNKIRILHLIMSRFSNKACSSQRACREQGGGDANPECELF